MIIVLRTVLALQAPGSPVLRPHIVVISALVSPPEVVA
jgi:hypothetical protein